MTHVFLGNHGNSSVFSCIVLFNIEPYFFLSFSITLHIIHSIVIIGYATPSTKYCSVPHLKLCDQSVTLTLNMLNCCEDDKRYIHILNPMFDLA